MRALRALAAISIGALALTLAGEARSQTRVRVWFDAFIDPTHPKDKDFSRKTEAGTRVIEAPDLWAPGLDIGALRGTCFSTDERTFDASPTASARGRVDFTVLFKGRRAIEVVPSPGREATRFIGKTRNVDCRTGKDLRPAESAGLDGIEIGPVRENGFLKLFNVRASIGDPFYKVLSLPVAPKLDFEFVFEYSVTGLKARIYGSTGIFPSFEGYYQIDDGPVVTFLRRPPRDDATPLHLFDMGAGFNTVNFSHEIDLEDQLL